MDDKNKAEKTGCPALFDQVPYKKTSHKQTPIPFC